MPGRSLGDTAQIRAIMEQASEAASEAAIIKFASQHPELRQSSVTTEIPPPLKWAGIILGSIMTLTFSGGFVWFASSVQQMQVTLARMDERMGSYMASQEVRMVELERRTSALENYHKAGPGR